MKIGVIIFILFVQFMIIGSFGSLHSYYISSKQVLTEQTNDYLKAIAQSRANHIGDFLDEYERAVALSAESPVFKDILITDKSDSSYDSFLEKANKRLKDMTEIHKEILKVSVLNKNGLVVASSDESSLDTTKKETINVLKSDGIYIKDAHMSKGFGVPCIDYGLPMFNDNGNLIGGIIIDLGLENLNKITTDRTGLGQTGEIYLINEYGYMITPSRFFPAEMTFLKLEVDTVNSRNCLMMKEMDIIEHIGHEPVAVFEDYRGVEVLGTHVYIPEMKWCLLAEIDETEALGELRNKLLISGIVISIIILIIIVFFIFLSGSFIKRLVEQAYSRKRGGKK